MGIKVTEGQYTKDHILNADSAFYCGTGAEIAGIQSVDEKVFPKNWEETLGKKIQEAYMKLVREQSYNHILTTA
jgi:branched-chain amino acid aminotransferase